MAQHDITHLVARIEAAGGSKADLLAIPNIEDQPQYGQLIAWNVRANAAAYDLVARLERNAQPITPAAPLLATDKQVDYAASLISRHMRSGEEGSWLSFTTTPTRGDLAAMPRRDISHLIDSLRDAYNR